MGRLDKKFFKSEEEDLQENNKNLENGVLKVTGKNFDRLIFNNSIVSEELKMRIEKDYSFILLVCKNHNKKSLKICNQAKKFINFLRNHYEGDKSHVRVGVMDHEYNEHPVIEKFNIDDFPVIIFFGRNDKNDNGKIYRGEFRIQKIVKWLNKKLMSNESGDIVLNDEDHQELVLLMAKNKTERKKLEKMIKLAKKKEEKEQREQQEKLLNDDGL